MKLTTDDWGYIRFALAEAAAARRDDAREAHIGGEDDLAMAAAFDSVAKKLEAIDEPL
jgi:hypothetical protein